MTPGELQELHHKAQSQFSKFSARLNKKGAKLCTLPSSTNSSIGSNDLLATQNLEVVADKKKKLNGRYCATRKVVDYSAQD